MTRRRCLALLYVIAATLACTDVATATGLTHPGRYTRIVESFQRCRDAWHIRRVQPPIHLLDKAGKHFINRAERLWARGVEELSEGSRHGEQVRDGIQHALRRWTQARRTARPAAWGPAKSRKKAQFIIERVDKGIAALGDLEKALNAMHYSSMPEILKHRFAKHLLRWFAVDTLVGALEASAEIGIDRLVGRAVARELEVWHLVDPLKDELRAQLSGAVDVFHKKLGRDAGASREVIAMVENLVKTTNGLDLVTDSALSLHANAAKTVESLASAGLDLSHDPELGLMFKRAGELQRELLHRGGILFSQ